MSGNLIRPPSGPKHSPLKNRVLLTALLALGSTGIGCTPHAPEDPSGSLSGPIKEGQEEGGDSSEESDEEDTKGGEGELYDPETGQEEEEGDNDEGWGGWVPQWDIYPGGTLCDVCEQDCLDPEKKCYPDADPNTVEDGICFLIEGEPILTGEACETQPDRCEKGAYCKGEEGGEEGICTSNQELEICQE